MKCPICNNECELNVIDTLDGLPVEEDNECGDCRYTHSYAYGYVSETIGGVRIDKSPHDSVEVSELKAKIMNIAVQIEKVIQS